MPEWMIAAGCEDTGCCETPDPCPHVRDDFDRTDNTDLGSDWTETLGNGAISGNALVITDSSSIMLHDETFAADPDYLYGHVVEAEITVTPNGRGSLIAGYASSSNYLYAEYILSSDGKTVSFRLVWWVGFDSQLASATVATYGTGVSSVTNRLRVCLTRGGIIATLETNNGGSGPTKISSVAAWTGTRVGVGTRSNSGTVTFADFTASRRGTNLNFTDGEPASECPGCPTFCANCVDAPPPTYNVTVPSGFTNDLCNACDIAGEYELQYVGGCQWKYVGPDLCTFKLGASCVAAPMHIEIVLTITTGSGNTIFTVQIFFASNQTCIDPTDPGTMPQYRGTVTTSDDACWEPPSSLSNIVASSAKACDSYPSTLGLAL